MANIKSAKKRIRTSENNRVKNKSKISELRTYIKKFETAIENENVEEARELIKVVDQQLKKAAHKNLIHENKASRTLGNLTKKLNKLG